MAVEPLQKAIQQSSQTPSEVAGLTIKTQHLDVQYGHGEQPVPTPDQVKFWVARALSHAFAQGYSRVECETAQLCVRLVDAQEGLALNETYRGKAKPTNVLSFAADADLMQFDLDGVQPLGDLVLCAPVVASEAREQNKSLNDHYAHLIVHGVLHLLGFDHEKEVAAREMELKEVDILQQLNIANPYE